MKLLGMFSAIGILIGGIFFFLSSPLENPKTVHVLFKTVPSQSELDSLKTLPGVRHVASFDSFPSPFFSRVIELQVDNLQITQTLKSFPNIVEVFEPQKLVPLSVYPTKIGPPKNFDDTFFSFQWALHNIFDPSDLTIGSQPELGRGHIVRKDLTDIDVEFVTSQPKDGSDNPYDLQLGSTSQEVANSESKPFVVVAVIDSGIDWSHPELENQVYKNLDECPDGRLPRPTEDRDGNGYDGDCIGWNFTAARSSPGRNRPFDILGHGTHVSGIMAAQANNSLGIAGLSSRIRIMPLKVVGYGSDVNEPQTPSAEEFDGFTHQLAKAIRYATHEGAQVINLSLGWPRVANTDLVQEAIREALSQNITIVAASGNNGHSSKILPCSIEGVICVGAIQNDGAVADYSNYGGQVDVMAPGHGILSTFPLEKTPTNFDVNGYEILNGTSQATPFVSGLVALLKLKFPKIPNNEIRARLIGTSRPVFMADSPSQLNLGGVIQFESALTTAPVPVMVPNFKDVSLIEFDSATGLASFDIKIENLWIDSKDIVVDIQTNQKDVKILQKNFLVSSMKAQSHETLRVPLQLNRTSDSDFEFSVTVRSNNGEVKKYIHHATLSQNLAFSEDLIQVDLDEKNPDFGGLRPAIDLRRVLSSPLLIQSKVNEEGLLEIRWLELQSNHQLKVLGITAIPRVSSQMPDSQFQVFAEDFESDGTLEFLVITLQKTSDSKDVLQLSFYDSQLNPLYGQASHWQMELKDAAPVFQDLRFVDMKVPGLGQVKTPIFLTEGLTPSNDQAPPLDFKSEGGVVERGIYIIEPKVSGTGVHAQVRRLNNSAFNTSLRSQLGIRDVDRLELIGMLPQSRQDLQSGYSTALYGYGKENSGQYAFLKLNGAHLKSRQASVIKRKFRHNLSQNQILPVLDIGGEHPLSNTSSAFTQTYQYNRVRSIRLDHNDLNLKEEVRYSTESRSEMLLGATRGFLKKDKLTVFVESGHRSLALSGSRPQDTQTFKRQIHRSTFLPGYFFSESMQPTTVLSAQGHLPGLYVDASSILSGNIVVWLVNQQSAMAPVQFNLRIPNDCKSIDRVYWKAKGTDTVLFECPNKLLALPLRLDL